jgi:hypothetical protein
MPAFIHLYAPQPTPRVPILHVDQARGNSFPQQPLDRPSHRRASFPRTKYVDIAKAAGKGTPDESEAALDRLRRVSLSDRSPQNPPRISVKGSSHQMYY